MTGNTLQTKALQLLQKSRQAFRLYARTDGRSYNSPAINRNSGLEDADLQELQKHEWRNVNAELIRTLGRILDVTSTKHLAHELFGVRESFLMRYRDNQATLRHQQESLIAATERSDFLVIPKIGLTLISLKALGQAQQAAIHEMDALLSAHRIAASQNQTNPVRGDDNPQSPQPLTPAPKTNAKVIPLRRAGAR